MTKLTKTQAEYLTALVAQGGKGSRWPHASDHLKVNGNVRNALRYAGLITEEKRDMPGGVWYTGQVITEAGRAAVAALSPVTEPAPVLDLSQGWVETSAIDQDGEIRVSADAPAPVQQQAEMQHEALATEPAAAEQTIEAAPVVIGEYQIPEQNLAAFEQKIAAVNRKAAKLGGAAITLARLGEAVVERTYIAYDVEGEAYERKGKFLVITVRVTGTEPRLNGWALAAVLEGTEAGTIIRTVPGRDLPREYQTADPTYCAHCGKRRRRSETFVLVHADGRYTQVGRQCLKDFLGGLDPHAMAAMAEYIASMANMAHDFGGRGERVYGTEEYLAWVLAAIREGGRGYVSRSRAQIDGGGSTADLAAHYLRIDNGDTRPDKFDYPLWVATVEDHAAAAALRTEALAMLAATDAMGTFEHNLATLLQLDTVRTKHMGTVAYAFGYVHRVREQQAKERAEASRPAPVNEYIGTEGERLTMPLTFTGSRQTEGQYGVRTMLAFADADGRVLVWWTGDYNIETVDEGTVYMVTGTVKRHGEYNGTLQTQLTRCVIADYDPASPPPAPKGSRGRPRKAVQAPAAIETPAEPAARASAAAVTEAPEMVAGAEDIGPASPPEMAVRRAVTARVRVMPEWVHDSAITAFDTGHAAIDTGEVLGDAALDHITDVLDKAYRASLASGDVHDAERNIVCGILPVLRVHADEAGYDLSARLDAVAPTVRARWLDLVGVDICAGMEKGGTA